MAAGNWNWISTGACLVFCICVSHCNSVDLLAQFSIAVSPLFSEFQSRFQTEIQKFTNYVFFMMKNDGEKWDDTRLSE